MTFRHIPSMFLALRVLLVATVSATDNVDAGSLPPCTLLNADGRVRDDATYSWTLRNLTVDTAPQLSNSTDPIGLRNVSFTLSAPALDQPVHCQGARYAPEDDVWQPCQIDPAGSNANETWLTFSTDFLIDSYVEFNQTWGCQAGAKRLTMQATGGESLGWFVCSNDTTTAVLEAVPGQCEHVQPLLSADDAVKGAVTSKNWTAATGDVIIAASINVLDSFGIER